MRSTLFTLVLTSAVAAAAALTPNTASAEAAKVNIPFSFEVAKQICPPGDYLVERDQIRNLVQLKSWDNSKAFNFVAGPGTLDRTGVHVVVKFDEMGDSHVLRSIQFGSLATARLDKKRKNAESMPVITIDGR